MVASVGVPAGAWPGARVGAGVGLVDGAVDGGRGDRLPCDVRLGTDEAGARFGPPGSASAQAAISDPASAKAIRLASATLHPRRPLTSAAYELNACAILVSE
jgi:hypothetical protein